MNVDSSREANAYAIQNLEAQIQHPGNETIHPKRLRSSLLDVSIYLPPETLGYISWWNVVAGVSPLAGPPGAHSTSFSCVVIALMWQHRPLPYGLLGDIAPWMRCTSPLLGRHSTIPQPRRRKLGPRNRGRQRCTPRSQFLEKNPSSSRQRLPQNTREDPRPLVHTPTIFFPLSDPIPRVNGRGAMEHRTSRGYA